MLKIFKIKGVTPCSKNFEEIKGMNPFFKILEI